MAIGLDRRLFGIVLIGLSTIPLNANAEYSQGLGDIEAATKDASAKLSDALRAFFQMEALIVRGRIGEAEEAKSQTLGLLSGAANAYEGARADGHILNPIPHSADEKIDFAYFNLHAARYQLSVPITQRDLVLGSSRIVREFARAVDGADIKRLTRDVRGLQRLGNSCADMQKFLISATTMLRIG